jgi:hypothetical protein
VQNPYNKIAAVVLSLMLIAANTRTSYVESGKRKYYLSRGSSIALFGAGESVFSACDDPTSLQYNPSLMAFFTGIVVNFSRIDLVDWLKALSVIQCR